MSFDTFGLHRTLLRAIQTLGYTDPTPIQQAAIPAIFTGRDVIGCAQTGTGKTAAYLLPVLHRLLQNATPGPRVLIVLPTRELAVQVDTQRRELASRTTPCVGQPSMAEYHSHLRLTPCVPMWTS